MDIILSIVSFVIKAIFGVVSSSMESEEKTKAEAYKKSLESTVESYDLEKDIRKAIDNVKPVSIDKTDIFGTAGTNSSY